jgi:hypothetical protein
MGRKQKNKDQLPDERTAPRRGSRPGRRASDSSGPGRRGRRASDSSGPVDGSGRAGRARRLALLLALAGAATYLVRRNQRKAELDEGIWHEAPAPAPTAPA